LPALEVLKPVLLLKGALLVSRICNDATTVDTCTAIEIPKFLNLFLKQRINIYK
jgi:hypothetical protein